MPMERFRCQGIHLVLAAATTFGARRKRSPCSGGSRRSTSGDQTCPVFPAPPPPYPDDPYLMASGKLAVIGNVIRPRPFWVGAPGEAPRWRAMSRSQPEFARYVVA